MFDCYGTLIDWDRGIHDTLAPLLARHGVAPSRTELLACFDLFERAAKVGGYVPYREVMCRVVDGFGRLWGFEATPDERECLARAIGSWTPYADTQRALGRLARHARLAVLSNIDDDLFRQTRGQLGVQMDVVITAQLARSYKPDLAHFHMALERLRLSPQAVVHVAASVHHDIEPARELGMRTVWVSRPRLGAPQAERVPADVIVTSLNDLI
jgi:2-haloacid dehalogenase